MQPVFHPYICYILRISPYLSIIPFMTLLLTTNPLSSFERCASSYTCATSSNDPADGRLALQRTPYIVKYSNVRADYVYDAPNQPKARISPFVRAFCFVGNWMALWSVLKRISGTSH